MPPSLLFQLFAASIVTPQTAEQFRLGLLQALQSPDANVSKSAAQAVAALAAYDVPRGVWPNLLPTLLNNVNDVNAATMSLPTKIASLNALGYMCETVNDIDTYEKSVVDQILHTVVSGMEASKPSHRVLHSARPSWSRLICSLSSSKASSLLPSL